METKKSQNLEPNAEVQKENATPSSQWHDEETEHQTHIGWYFAALFIAILLMASVLYFKPL